MILNRSVPWIFQRGEGGGGEGGGGESHFVTPRVGLQTPRQMFGPENGVCNLAQKRFNDMSILRIRAPLPPELQGLSLFT